MPDLNEKGYLMTLKTGPRRIGRRQFITDAASASAGLVVLGGCGPDQDQFRNEPATLQSALPGLRSSVEGTLIRPGEDLYDAARRVGSFNPTSDKRPALIVRCAGTADVVKAVEFARSLDLEIAVRGGGHDVLGESVCEGGVLIDLGPMKGIQVDPESGVATLQAGLRAGEVNEFLQTDNLAAALGCNPGVGISGLTLGGGLGWFLGRFGATCDNLVAAEVVTADGRTLRASEDENADLFWGLRGGGGNFGIVTSFQLRCHPVGQVTGGFVAYRGSQAREFLRFYADYMEQAPDELTVELTLQQAREPLVLAMACYSGDPDRATEVLAPLRAFGPPLADSIGLVPYARLTDPPQALGPLFERDEPAEADSERAGPGQNYWRGITLPSLNDRTIDALLECVAIAPVGWSVGLGHYLHGAASRVEAGDMPVLRDLGASSLFFSASWQDPSDAETSMGWVEDALELMRPVTSEGTYINYLSSGSQAAVRSSYGDNYARLVALKGEFDPQNVFHLNRNIRPVA
jgi:FAD/FMN-containing dehydrogenase